jgi:hypothetical protein
MSDPLSSDSKTSDGTKESATTLDAMLRDEVGENLRTGYESEPSCMTNFP